MNQQLLNEYIQWSQDTFGNEKWLDLLLKLRHEELWELRNAIELESKQNQAAELADCFLLLFKVAHLNGFNVEYIEVAMECKLIEVHNRKYNNGKRIK
jgi:NTP pyrophosphatase (non-canonical NTP hydrolase)